MIRTAMVGLGKMGLSHLAIVRAHPGVDLVAGCDASTYLTDVLTKHAGLKCYSDFDRMLDQENLDALIVATPSKLHASMVRKALERGLHIFCEKPFVLDPLDGDELVALAERKSLVNQVGYHYRFVGAFKEAARIVWIDSVAQIDRLSLSGRVMRHVADLCLAQWPDVAAHYPNVEYAGEVL